MRLAARRLEGGRPLRDAIKEGGYTYQGLAAKTRDADPDGRGVGFQLIAAIQSQHRWGRETTSPRSARLIAKALGIPEGELFAMPDITEPEISTLN